MTKSRLSLAVLLLSIAAVGRLAFDRPPDQVETDLQSFRRETDPAMRIALIKKFGHNPDPRVTVALMEVVLQTDMEESWRRMDGKLGVLLSASFSLVRYHIPEEDLLPAKYWTTARLWWEKAEADVRRRADAIHDR